MAQVRTTAWSRYLELTVGGSGTLAPARPTARDAPSGPAKSPLQIILECRQTSFKLQQTHAKEQLQKAVKKEALQQQQEMASIWRELMKIDNAIVIRKMNNPDPVISIVAIQVAAKKRLPVEKECIALLASANPKVRQAARQTLVRLGRSVDFGPEPTATPQQIAASVRSWSSWADIQTEEPDEPAEQTETP